MDKSRGTLYRGKRCVTGKKAARAIGSGENFDRPSPKCKDSTSIPSSDVAGSFDRLGSNDSFFHRRSPKRDDSTPFLRPASLNRSITDDWTIRRFLFWSTIAEMLPLRVRSRIVGFANDSLFDSLSSTSSVTSGDARSLLRKTKIGGDRGEKSVAKKVRRRPDITRAELFVRVTRSSWVSRSKSTSTTNRPYSPSKSSQGEGRAIMENEKKSGQGVATGSEKCRRGEDRARSIDIWDVRARMPAARHQNRRASNR